MNFVSLQILSVAVYNHYKRIYYESLQKGNVRPTDEGYAYSTISHSSGFESEAGYNDKESLLEIKFSGFG